LLTAALCVLSIFGACGKRGPLYLPDKVDAPMKAGGQAAKPVPSDTGK
jgi:predicted small lipoprotein YifL